MSAKTKLKHLESHLILRLSRMADNYNAAVQLDEQQYAHEYLRLINELESALDYLGQVTIEKQPNRYLAKQDYFYPIDTISFNGETIF